MTTNVNNLSESYLFFKKRLEIMKQDKKDIFLATVGHKSPEEVIDKLKEVENFPKLADHLKAASNRSRM